MHVTIGRYKTDKDPSDWERTVKVKINGFDIWNLDHTLAQVIYPALVKFREHLNGYPGEFAEPEDFPEGEYPSGYTGGGIKAWEIILDHMIWAFKEILDDEYMMRFYHERDNNDDRTWTLKVDAHEKKIQAGLDLFGHYYRGLWN